MTIVEALAQLDKFTYAAPFTTGDTRELFDWIHTSLKAQKPIVDVFVVPGHNTRRAAVHVRIEIGESVFERSYDVA